MANGVVNMATPPERLVILGVRHPDRRIPELVNEYVKGSVDKLFHESPESDTSTSSYAFWTLIRNPLAVIVGSLRLSAFVLSNLRFALSKVVAGKADTLTFKSEGQAQGRRAARNLANKFDIDWKPVDMDRVERVRHLPILLSVMSWFVVAFGIFSLFVMARVPTAGVILTLGSVGFGVVVSRAIGDQRRPARDQRMFDNIVEACDEGDHAVLITGENHVKGVASRADASGIDYDAYWLSSTADNT